MDRKRQAWWVLTFYKWWGQWSPMLPLFYGVYFMDSLR
jgi:hypothetical protein